MRMPSFKTLIRAKKQTPPESMAASTSVLQEDETADGWVFLITTRPDGGPPKPSPMAMGIASDQAFDPTAENLVGVYLPCRRMLHFHELPRQIHDADVYTTHPAHLASIFPAANERFEWFFFVCRGRRAGGRRRAGPGAYRLTSESALPGNGYHHTFQYYEDSADASAGTETEWQMEEYGTCSSGDACDQAIEMVVCKLYAARGGALHARLATDRAALAARHADAEVKPQVLVQFYMASFSMGDPLRCRIYPADDVYGAHPAVLTTAYPVANDRFEWFFFVWRARAEPGDDDAPCPRRAGPGVYVPVRHLYVMGSRNSNIGYRRLFRYREDEAEVRRAALTEWRMEEFGFGPDFPYMELPAAKVRDGDTELIVCKVYQRLIGDSAVGGSMLAW